MATTMTLADLAATSLSAVRILEQHGLDYCCGGKQLLEEACIAKGVKPQTIIWAIEEARGSQRRRQRLADRATR